MASKIGLKGMLEVFVNSIKGFHENKVTKLSGSLAFYTVFSMGPLIIVVISLGSMFLGKEAMEGRVYAQMAGFIGSDSAEALQQIIIKASLAGKSKMAAIVGGVILLIGATSVFAEIQDSINTIWGLKPKPKRGWVKFLEDRFLSFSVIIGLGFLLLVSLLLSTIIDGFSDHLKARFPEVTIMVFYATNLIITLVVTTLIFGFIFKVLPDATIKWKDVIVGAITTALLFMLGKFGMSLYISKSQVGSTYGAAGSLVVLLLWIFYSSIVLYYGAEFTKAFAIKYGSKIYPNQYAVTTKLVEVETGRASIQTIEKVTIETTAEINGEKVDIITPKLPDE